MKRSVLWVGAYEASLCDNDDDRDFLVPNLDYMPNAMMIWCTNLIFQMLSIADTAPWCNTDGSNWLTATMCYCVVPHSLSNILHYASVRATSHYPCTYQNTATVIQYLYIWNNLTSM